MAGYKQKTYPIVHAGIRYEKKAISCAKPDEVGAGSRAHTELKTHGKEQRWEPGWHGEGQDGRLPSMEPEKPKDVTRSLRQRRQSHGPIG